jgi:hypothetical protein
MVVGREGIAAILLCSSGGAGSGLIRELRGRSYFEARGVNLGSERVREEFVFEGLQGSAEGIKLAGCLQSGGSCDETDC